MQTQPPPDAPPSPLQEDAIPSRKKWSWLKAIVILAVLFLLAGLTAPMTLRCRKKADQTEAVNNARQIGLALFEFQEEYGSFPDATTIAPVRQATESTLTMGSASSNDFFRQLIAAGIAQSEAMFYAKIDGTRKPDGVFDKGAEALKKGECGFTYFLGARNSDSTKRPLVVTAMIPGTDRFDRKRFDGRAVILRMDNSVSSHNIDKDGHVIVDGRNLMDPHHPIWDGHAPAIAWPE